MSRWLLKCIQERRFPWAFPALPRDHCTCPSTDPAGMASSSPQPCPAWPRVLLSQANSPALTSPCCQGSAQCQVQGCPQVASALLQAGVMDPGYWSLPSCPWRAPMALVPSPEGASMPYRCIAEHPKWESHLLFYFRLTKGQGRCQSPFPHAGSVGHWHCLLCQVLQRPIAEPALPQAVGQHGPNSWQTFSSPRDSYSIASTVLACVLVTIVENGLGIRFGKLFSTSLPAVHNLFNQPTWDRII